KCDPRRYLPRILCKNRKRSVLDLRNRIAKTLNIGRRQPESVRLNRCHVGRRLTVRSLWKGRKVRRGERPEIEQAGEVQFEDRVRNIDKAYVAAKFECVVS